MVCDSDCPTASSRFQPKMTSACEFQPMIRPLASIVTTASSALSTMARTRASLSRNDSSALAR